MRREGELILMGNGIGFGKKPTQQIESVPGAKVYSLVTRRKQQSVLKVVNGIHPSFIEASGRIIEEAEKVFKEVDHEILLPMADHIALAAKRAKENRQIPNPFTPGYPGAFFQGICSCDARPGYHQRDDGIRDIG